MKNLNTEELKKILRKILEDADKLDQEDEDIDEDEELEDDNEDEDEDEDEDEYEYDEYEDDLELNRECFVNSMIDWVLSLPYLSKNSKDYIEKDYDEYSEYLCKVIKNKVEPKIYDEGRRIGYRVTLDLFEAAAFYLFKFI